jgi:type IV pilus assembly protein PilV
MMQTNLYRRCSGSSLIEVLIALLITLIGLLGIAALQARAQQSEMESYQRSQALIVLSDIVDRININRATTSCFAITTDTADGKPFIGVAGAGHMGAPACSASTSAYNTQADAAITALDNLLKGSAETLGGSNVGSMIGARACISYDETTEIGGVPGTGLYTVIVSWQAMTDLAPPVANCANGLYGAETKRRAVSTSFRIANLYG